MEQTATKTQVDLFGESVPDLDQIEQISVQVHANELSTAEFARAVDQQARKNTPQAAVSAGIGYYILADYEQAAHILGKATDCPQKFVYLAKAQRKLDQFDQSLENLEQAQKLNADKLTVTLEKAQTYRYAGDFEAAHKELASLSNYDGVSAEYHYQLGRLLEVQGEYVKGARNYEKAIEILPEHHKALFHLAYRSDLFGDEEAAIDYYRQLISIKPVYVSALLNLAVIYEDRAEYDKAYKCVQKVLKYHPNHARARLFGKDIESSQTMFFDEERERRKDRKNQMLETPISDFELSVRSRNCLRKMNIRTIGDLLNITEPELLSYKNFGETSLKEIKAILDSKGLHLGMKREEGQFAAEQAEQQQEQQQQHNELYNKPIEDLQLSVRAKKCLEKLNLRTIGDLAAITEAELLGCKNFGVTSLNEIKKALSEIGLSLRKLD